MDNVNGILTRYRLDRAVELLKIAETLYSDGYYKDANNRAYYAVFYAIKSIYATRGVDFRKHKTMIANFNKDFIATGIFPKEIGRGISVLQYVRE